MPDGKLSITEFAAKIKAKYPSYKDVDDVTLAKKIVEKYPDYASSVDLSGSVDVKKKRTFYTTFRIWWQSWYFRSPIGIRRFEASEDTAS